MAITVADFIQLLLQDTDPTDPLVNAAQVWMNSSYNLRALLHQEGDPGINVDHKLLDFTYATFFGKAEAVTAAATIALAVSDFNLVTCTLDQNVIFNATGGHQGQRLYFVLLQDGTGNRSVTFNTNFNSSGIRVAPANEYMQIAFIYAGSIWHEITGRQADVKYGQSFLWQFKMVDETDFATPETGLTPAVQISKDGGALAGLTGAPAVSEIGSGWYKVIVPATDMAADTALLIATSAGAAQTDEVLHTS